MALSQYRFRSRRPTWRSITGGESDARKILSELARDAVRLSVDGEAVPPVIDEVSLEDGAARVRMSFAIAASRDQARRLTIASDVPKRIALRPSRVDGREPWTIAWWPKGCWTPNPVRWRLTSTLLLLQWPALHGAFWSWASATSCPVTTIWCFSRACSSRRAAVRQLAVALTAFTAAHSVSLALVVIGGFHAPPSIVEPLIAASIAWVGIENLMRRQHGARWFVVFGFGLIHGFGFAGALMELGFGSSATEMALALISFNVGVEAGQLAVAAAMMPLVWMIRSRPVWQARLLPLCSVMIVMAGGYWLIERLL